MTYTHSFIELNIEYNDGLSDITCLLRLSLDIQPSGQGSRTQVVSWKPMCTCVYIETCLMALLDIGPVIFRDRGKVAELPT